MLSVMVAQVMVEVRRTLLLIMTMMLIIFMMIVMVFVVSWKAVPLALLSNEYSYIPSEVKNLQGLPTKIHQIAFGN